MSLDSHPELASTIIQSITGNRDQQNSVGNLFKQKEETSILQRLASGLRDSSFPSQVDFQGKDGIQQSVRSLDATKRNIGEGMSMLQSADYGLDQIQQNLERLNQLAEQASDPRYSQDVRDSLQKEANALIQDIQRITESTEYKGQQLLSQDAASRSFQIGPHSQEVSRLSVGFDQGILGRLEITESTSTSPGETSTSEGNTETGSGTNEADTGTPGESSDTTDTGSGTTSPDESTDTSTGDTSASDTQPVTTVAEITTNEEIAATFGWEVNDDDELVIGKATADALSGFWERMLGNTGNGNGNAGGNGNNSPDNTGFSGELANRLDLDAATEGEVNHQYISETFDIDGQEVEYNFLVSFTVTTDESGERVLDEIEPARDHQDEWINGSPISVTLGDEQLAVLFNRNLNQNQNQGYNYLEDPSPGGFQNFGVLTPDYERLNVENVEQAASPNPDATTDPVDGSTGGGDTGSSQDETTDTGGSTGTADPDNTTTSGTEDNLLKSILTSDLASSQPIQLSSPEAAQNLVQKTQEATDFIKGMRSDLEAGMNKLGSVMAGNQAYSQALQQNMQRIEDAVSAQQAATRAQEQILTHTTSAAMGIANTTDDTVLALLKDPEASTKEIPYYFAPKEEEEEQPASQNITAFSSEDNEEDQPLYQYPPEEEEAANHFFSNFTASNVMTF